MLIRGALANAPAFTGSSYLFHRLSADNIDAERKRHNAAIEALQKAQIEWTHKRQEQIDFINNQLRLERKAETNFTELTLFKPGFFWLSMTGGGWIPPPSRKQCYS